MRNVVRFCRWLVLCTCVPALMMSCGVKGPPKKIVLPERISEASGLVISGDSMIWHNDSGDGPFLYLTDLEGEIRGVDTLRGMAVDYEDICEDDRGLIYVGDFGNNRGQRENGSIYIYNREDGSTEKIAFNFPGQDGSGRSTPGNYDCEAMVYENGWLHLFTKDNLSEKRAFYINHFRLPARPGNYEAELVDKLYLPRRVVTGAALDSVSGELYLVAYNFKMLLGFLPSSSASLVTFSDYPEGRYLQGKMKRRNISWAIPTQHEAVAIYDDEFLYIAAEATRIRRRAIARRKRR